MNTPNWTILILTRSRPVLLTNLLQSIQDTVIDKTNIETIVAYDLDDEMTKEIIPRLNSRFMDIGLRMYGRNRSINLSKDYVNWLVFNYSHGKYISGANDDCLYKTHGWDQVAFQKLEDYMKDKPDGIVYGRTDDMTPNKPGGGEFTCFPVISRSACDALGGFLDEEFNGWCADIAIYYVYRDLGRVVDLPEIQIEHISHHAGKREKDGTDHHIAHISNGQYFHGPGEFVVRDVAILKKYIENFYKKRSP